MYAAAAGGKAPPPGGIVRRLRSEFGGTCRLSLAVSTTPSGNAAPDSPTGSTTGGAARLLVVDDNEMNRDMLSRRLVKAGYEVEIATDGPTALARLGVREAGGEAGTGPGAGFDAVLLDVMMPGIDGFEVLRRLRAAHSTTDLPVIMATAKDQREDIVQALNLGANDYVTKPLDFPVVLARVATQVAIKRNVDRILTLERSLERRNLELAAANQRMRKELQLAARVQQALLPTELPELAGVKFAWTYRPCDELGGDSLNVVPLTDRHVGVYLLDVSGHGVPAALLSVTLTRLLAPGRGERTPLLRRGEPVPPAEVAAELNRRFPMDEATLQYFTLFYGVLDVQQRELRYATAGHPPPILVDAAGRATIAPIQGGSPIGWFPEAPYAEQSIRMSRGERLLIHSDGISEAMNAQREQFGVERIIGALRDSAACPMGAALEAVVQQAAAWSAREGSFADDVSAVAIEAV